MRPLFKVKGSSSTDLASSVDHCLIFCREVVNTIFNNPTVDNITYSEETLPLLVKKMPGML